MGAKVGILVLLTVSGDFEESGALLSFGTQDDQSYFEKLPIWFNYRFQNEGADRVVPQGTIAITNLFGWTSEEVLVNASESNVLPKSIRKFEETWGSVLTDAEMAQTGFWAEVGEQWNDFACGPYTATLLLTYGSDQTEATAAVDFWVFPWQLLLTGTLFILTLLFTGVFIIRSYNRWIIKNALKAFAQVRQKKGPRQ